MHLTSKLSSVFVCLLGVAVLSGCESGPDIGKSVAKANKTNMQKVANSLYLHQSIKGKVPKNEEQLCDFIANDASIDERLSLMQIDRSSFREYLISERDGEPYHVRYGVGIPYGGRIPLVLETVGVDGSRQVCWSDTKITEVSDEKEYKRLKTGKVKSSGSIIPEASGNLDK